MRALFFDLDGTLVDTAVDIALAMSNLRLARGGETVGADQVRPLVSLGAERLVETLLGPLAGDRAADLGAFRAELGSLQVNHAAIFPGVVDALSILQRYGRAMAVVTNKPEALSRALLDGLGLTHFFGAIVGGDTMEVGKPDAAPLARAAADLGWDLNDAVMIGDTIIDAEAARRAGISFILFAGGYGGPDCRAGRVDGQFERFSELPDLLDRLG